MAPWTGIFGWTLPLDSSLDLELDADLNLNSDSLWNDGNSSTILTDFLGIQAILCIANRFFARAVWPLTCRFLPLRIRKFARLLLSLPSVS